MHNTTIDFKYIQGLTLASEDRQKISRVQSALRELLITNEAGSMGGSGTGNLGEADIGMTVHDRAFVESEIIQKLDDLQVLDEVEVRYEEENGEEIKIHPREE